MSANPRIEARNARAKLSPAGVPAEKAAPPKAPEVPAAPIPAADAAHEPDAPRRRKKG